MLAVVLVKLVLTAALLLHFRKGQTAAARVIFRAAQIQAARVVVVVVAMQRPAAMAQF
jgi:hypothetical protein